MKKLLCILLLFLSLAGCAHRQPDQSSYSPPDWILRKLGRVINGFNGCVKPGKTVMFAIAQSDAKNAWYDAANSNIVITAGALTFDEDTLRLIIAHEAAHAKFSHAGKAQAVSGATTAAMLVANIFVPGVGLLNHAINPLVTNAYSKPQETEADLYAYEACLCMGMSREQIIGLLEGLRSEFPEGGGFWDSHPSWSDRIAKIKNPSQ